MGSKEFELFYKSVQSTTTTFNKLLNNSKVNNSKIILSEYVRGFDVDRPKNGAYFEAISKTISMQKNTEEFIRLYKIDVARGWFPRGTTADDVFSHEIGHAVSMSKIKNKLDYLIEIGKLNKIVDKALMELYGRKEGKGFSNEEKAMLIKSGLSEYATKNSAETIAEAFAEYSRFGINARPLAKAILQEWQKTLSEYEQKLFQIKK
ncbi:MAG: hypothetical protein LBQ47_09020 [Endomicrobium sp.]|jgi:hypothetical protein|nr:hypothetical protein [Endomicrobium sp.]